MAEKYNLVVIGAGPAGYVAAAENAARGKRTALIENRELGGTCLNRGCIPTKTILHSAEIFSEMKACEHLGIHAENICCSMAGVQARKEEVIGQLRSGIAMMMKKHKVDVFYGTGTIIGRHEVRVVGNPAANGNSASNGNPAANGNSEANRNPAANESSAACGSAGVSGDGEMAACTETQVLETEHILIATGSVPAVPPVPGMDLHDVINSDELLDKREIYPRLTIIGGGVIGMEFASIYSSLGAQVTVIEFLDRILANMDKEISQNLKMILKKRGVDIHTGACVEEIKEGPEGALICCYREKDTRKETVSDGVLVAVGRRANTGGLLAEGVELSMDRGRIIVDEHYQTSIPGIYAVGDVTGGMQLAHTASSQAINAVAYMAGEEMPVCMDCVPGCVYTNPEIGSVGLTQEEAKTKGISVITKKYPMSANGKSLLSGQERGFIKVVADSETHRILGAQMMCARATDMISEFGTAIVNGLTLEQMGAVIRPHPTFSEGISEAVRG